MKRPLATFCFAWALTQLIFIKLPLAALLLGGAFLLLTFIVVNFTKNRQRKIAAAVILSGMVAAICWMLGFEAVVLQPMDALCGQTHTVQAVVQKAEQEPDAEGFTVTLRLQRAGETRIFSANQLVLSGLAACETGDRITLPVAFAETSRETLPRGQYLSGKAAGELQRLGREDGLSVRAALLGQRLGKTLRTQLTGEIGGFAAAVCAGDRTGLTSELFEISQRAGISHLLAVSGMHLSIVSSVLLLFLPRRRRVLRLLLGGLGIFCFAALTGATPSVLRAGIMLLLVLTADALSECADTPTSVGFAWLLLTLGNPFSAANIGLLLSCTATLGVGASGAVLDAIWAAQNHPGKWRKRALHLLPHLLVPVMAAIATLPVLIALGWGVSLWSIPANLLALPVLPYLMVSGLLGALIFSPFPAAGRLLLGLCGLLARWVVGVARFFAQFSFGYLTLRGGYVVTVLAVLAALGFLIWKVRPRRALCLFAAALLVWSLALGALLSRNTVRVAMVKTGSSPAVVVRSGRKAAVLWSGGSRGAIQLEAYLQRENVRRLVLLCDFSSAKAEQPTLRRYQPEKYCKVAENDDAEVTFALFDGIICSIQKQSGGSIGLIEVGEYRLLMTAGAPNVSHLPQVDACFAGAKRPEGLRTACLVSGTAPPDWVQAAPERRCTAELPVIFLRKGRSMLCRKEQWSWFASS